ncbi:hypothetical protein ACFOWX_02215 [Sphingorhabdus arenilitoris]|uniref:Uncharacterized protein n=1 Tax=Sphingorhabdus arenilitoris TaxID=1490041 RepID=A0ABV8RD06_9SPHN
MINSLPLLLLAAVPTGAGQSAAVSFNWAAADKPVSPPVNARAATAVGKASAQIVKAERITFRSSQVSDQKTDRQISQRGAMSVTEFY